MLRHQPGSYLANIRQPVSARMEAASSKRCDIKTQEKTQRKVGWRKRLAAW